MRDIKFRAWDTKYKEWLCEQEMPILSDTNNKIWEFGDTDHCRFMQYTGLKDKNGKEIYEGHILKSSYGNRVVAVRYVDSFLTYGVFTAQEWGRYQGGSNHFKYCFADDREHEYFLFEFESFEVEIIGNVHQHPELLG